MRSVKACCLKLMLLLLGFLFSLTLCEVLVRAFVNVRNVGPSFTVYDPYYGKVLKKNYSTTRIGPEFTMRLTTNSHGFRGPPIAQTSVRPILFLGDSFTMGYGVTDGEEFPDLVRRALNADRPDAVPVINAGIGDNATGPWLKFLRTNGERLNPGLVVLQVHANDFFGNTQQRIYDVTSGGELRERPVPPPGVMRVAQSVLEAVPGLMHSYLVGLARQIVTREEKRGAGEINNVEDPLLLRLMEEVVAVCGEHDWPVLAVLADLEDARRTSLKNFFDAHGAPRVIIPTKVERPDLYFEVDGHWNASGHRFTADRVLNAIETFELKYW